MSIIGFLIGFLHILAYGGVLLLVGLLVKWLVEGLWRPLPEQATRLWIGIVALICLAMLIGLLVGFPVPSPFRL